MGRRKTDAELLANLEKSMGMIAIAARKSGVSRTTLYKRISKSQTLREGLEQITEETLDTAEVMIIKAIREGEPWAIQFFLKTKGKHRGYTERTELTGADGTPLITTDDLERRIARATAKVRADEGSE